MASEECQNTKTAEKQLVNPGVSLRQPALPGQLINIETVQSQLWKIHQTSPVEAGFA